MLMMQLSSKFSGSMQRNFLDSSSLTKSIKTTLRKVVEAMVSENDAISLELQVRDKLMCSFEIGLVIDISLLKSNGIP
jgi:hypothetical protein